MTNPTPIATLAVDGFIKNLPPETKLDEIRLAYDYAVAIKADAAVLIDTFSPAIPVVGGFGFVKKLLKNAFNGLIDQSNAALTDAINKSPQGGAK